MSSTEESPSSQQHENTLPSATVAKRCGQKLGCKVELVGLLPGGSGGRREKRVNGSDPEWHLDGGKHDDLSLDSASVCDEDSLYS